MIKKNLFYTLLLSVSQFIFPLITFPYSSRILGPKGIGAVNFIDSFTQYFLLIAALGIPTYGVREIAKRRNDPQALNKLFSEILVIHLFSTLILAVFYIGIAFLLPDIRVHLHLVLIGVLLMFCSVFTIDWLYSGIEQFSYITLRSLIIRSVSVIALFLILKPGSSPETYYMLIVLAAALTAAFNIINLKKHVQLGFKQLAFKSHYKPLFILLSSALAVSVYVFIDNIILGFIKNEEAVGIYSTATKIVKLPFAILVAINAVIIPKVSAAYNEGRLNDIQELINKSFAFLCVVGLPIMVGVFVSAKFLVHTFAGEKFIGAVPVLQILSPVTMLVGLTFIFAAQLLTPMGQEQPLVKISVLGMVFSLSLNLILIPWLSSSGAAITNVLTELLVTILCYRLTIKHINIKFDRKIFLNCLLGSLSFIPLAIILHSVINKPFVADITIMVVCAVAYILYILLFVKNAYVDNLKNDVLSKLGLLKTKALPGSY